MPTVQKQDVFQRILERAEREGIDSHTKKSRQWFYTVGQKVRVDRYAFVKKVDQSRLTHRIVPGKMYAFVYDPKTKEDLPYYDVLPLVFPFKKVEDGFYGLNLHYLPPLARTKLMDALYSLATSKYLDEKTKLRMSYSTLNAAGRFRLFRPCIKRYLYSHVRSQFVAIDSNEWALAITLPMASFRKADSRKVYYDSMKSVLKKR